MLSTVAQNNTLDWSGTPSAGVLEVFWRRNKILLRKQLGTEKSRAFLVDKGEESVYTIKVRNKGIGHDANTKVRR